MTETATETRDYATNGFLAGDRKPEHLPLAEGWDWYQYTDGSWSTRWIHFGPVRAPGTLYRCTACGRETERYRGIRVHNREGACRGQVAA